MDIWTRLYEQPALLSKEWGHQRIYAPMAYRRVRAASLAPIVHTEVLDLAPLFPTCWTAAPEGPELVVLRSLLPEGAAIPGGEKAAAAVLPLVFRAYPVVAPVAGGEERAGLRVDRAIADAPTDIGAPLMLASERLARATTMRARLALQVARALPATRSLSRFIHDEGLLEPWPLRFDLGHGESIAIDNLMVLARDRLDGPLLHRAIRLFGVEAGLFFSAHRLSLFRIASLLSAAKAVVASRQAPQARVAA